MDLYSIRKHFEFDSKEKQYFLLTAFLAAFVLTFEDWGADVFSISIGLTNLLIAVIFIGLFLFLHISAQKVAAIYFGFKLKYFQNVVATFVSVFFCFLFLGSIPLIGPLFFPGAFSIKMIPTLRIGAFRHDTSVRDMAKIGVASVLASIFIMIFFYVLFYFTKAAFFGKLMEINFLIAIYSIIPVPRSPGWHVFFASRWQFPLIFISVLIFGILIHWIGLASLIIAIILGGFSAVLFQNLTKPRRY